MQRKHTLKVLCFCEKFALKNARWKKVDIKRQWAGPDVLTVFELQAHLLPDAAIWLVYFLEKFEKWHNQSDWLIL